MKKIVVILTLVLLYTYPSGVSAQKKLKKKVDKLQQSVEFLKQAVDNNYSDLLKTKKVVEEYLKKFKKTAGDLKILEAKQKQNEMFQKKTKNEISKINKKLEKISKKLLDVGGQFRVRDITYGNYKDFNSDKSDATSFTTHRVRLDFKLKPYKNIKFLFQLQDSRIWGAKNISIMNNPSGFEFHQAFLHIDDFGLKNLNFDIGRMVLSYGSERLIGADDFQTVGNTFDGFRLSYTGVKDTKIDAFVTTIRETGNQDDKDYTFGGIYSTYDGIKNFPFDVYLLFANDNAEKTYKNIGIAGALIRATLFNSIYFEGEAAFQFGKVTEPIYYKKNSHFAVMYYGELAYLLKGNLNGKIGVFGYIASGDAEPRDDQSVQFITLFPSIHKYWGSMDMLTGTNLKNFGAKINLNYQKIKAVIAYNEFFTYDDAAPLPRFGKTNRPPLKRLDSHLGSEFDFCLRYNFSKSVSFATNYGIFIPYDGAKEYKGAKDGSSPAHYFYLQGLVNF